MKFWKLYVLTICFNKQCIILYIINYFCIILLYIIIWLKISNHLTTYTNTQINDIVFLITCFNLLICSIGFVQCVRLCPVSHQFRETIIYSCLEKSIYNLNDWKSCHDWILNMLQFLCYTFFIHNFRRGFINSSTENS